MRSHTLANDGFDTLVLLVCVAMSSANNNRSCGAKKMTFCRIQVKECRSWIFENARYQGEGGISKG